MLKAVALKNRKTKLGGTRLRLGDETRFANPGFARDEDRLPLSRTNRLERALQ